MATADRRQREREAREELILDAAAALVLDRGYLGVNMDLLAEAVDYSKGTIYQHFANKEDVLAAVIERMADERVSLFQRAAMFQGRPRERMAAVGMSFELFVLLHPTHFRLEQIVMADSIREKLPHARQTALIGKEEACVGIVAGIVRDGIATGDLVMPEDSSPEALVAGLWMTTYGGMSMLTGHLGRPEDLDPGPVLQRTQNAILDGYGWRPLWGEWDYGATRRRIAEEVFPDEARDAGLL